MFFRIGSYEFFIEPAPQFSFLEFDHINHGPPERELWLMGRRIVMARRT